MLFNSLTFLFQYLPMVLVAFFLLGRIEWRGIGPGLAALWLGIASLAFYGWDDPKRLLSIILSSIFFNYIIGNMLARTPNKWLLYMGVSANLVLLGYYKYAYFTLDIVQHLTGAALPKLDIALPIGISFFTFTQIAFLVDAYYGKAKEYKPHHYLLFVTFFPHLIAGPILHHKEMMPQFAEKSTYRINPHHMALGLTWFSAGLFKKMVFADNLSNFVTPVFKAAGSDAAISFADAWLGAIAFTLQLYFDFSGYSDMAIGLAYMFNIKLPINFNSPYQATSIIEFWRRWHMTLSRFLRDYVYIPLGGNRHGTLRRYGNLLLTMLIGGLWHGAAWNFVLWGGLHGMALALNHCWRRISPWRLPSMLGWLLTFAVVVWAWVPFRASNLHETLSLWKSMLHIFHADAFHYPLLEGFPAWSNLPPALGMIIALLAFVALLPNTQQLLDNMQENRSYWRWACLGGALFGMSLAAIFIIGSASEFIYFRF